MENWRLIITEPTDSFTNMGIDEAIMYFVSEKKVPPTLRFYRWNRYAAALGAHQSVYQELDIDYCKTHNIEIFRRISGGGAVLKDPEGELNYSISVREDHPIIPKDIKKTHEVLCEGIVIGLKKLGFETAEFVPINDIIINGRKVSGNAQARKYKTILHHGTILLKVDVKKMFSVLKVGEEKIRGKLIKNVEERVTSLEQEMGRTPSFEEVEKALIKGFEESLNVKFIKDSLTEEELTLARKLAKEKYSQDSWNFRR
ncbi:MAG TPA: lipoate--protein ligase family protein [Candidatus Atribacteria bacterium]|nr:lipoate--protein ligase family protein [Candidatus Atribacteria bacterium]